MSELRTGLLAGLLLSPLALAGCTSTAIGPSAGLALSSTADLTLPETVAVVPTAFRPEAGSDPARRIKSAAKTDDRDDPVVRPAAFAKAGGPAPAAAALAAETPDEADPSTAARAVAPAPAVAAASRETPAAVVATTGAALPAAPPPLAGPALRNSVSTRSSEPLSTNRPRPAAAAPAAIAATPAAHDGADVRPQTVALASAAVTAGPVAEESRPGAVDTLIVKYAAAYRVPVELVRRVVKRESNFFPGAYNHGHWGLMQIKHATARGMGYEGPAKGLLDAETNLKYAVKYLRGAWLVAEGDQDRAVQFYARGYYYDAKRQGLLDETGLGTDRRRRLPSSI